MSSEKPPKTPRKESVDDRLLSTAGRCFLEDGFGFGIDDILAESKVAKMSLYVKFQSKYGLIERLLEEAAKEWRVEIDRVAADTSLRGLSKVVHLLKTICALSRDPKRRTGLLGQALVEFPRTGKGDESHKKKDLVHEKARQHQRDLLKALEGLCVEAGVENPLLASQQFLLLVNGYLVMEPLLGKPQAIRLIEQTAQVMFQPGSKARTPAQKPARPTGRRVKTPGIDYDPNPSEPEQTSPPSKQKLRRVQLIDLSGFEE
jgi:AcrR family transcriptional regulator